MGRSDSFGLVCSDIWTLLLFETVCRGSQDRSENPYRATRKYVGKFRSVHCRTWNMARKLKLMENEKHPLEDLKND